MALRPVCFWLSELFKCDRVLPVVLCWIASAKAVSWAAASVKVRLSLVSSVKALVICKNKFQKLFVFMLDQKMCKKVDSGTQCKVAAVVSVWEGQDTVTHSIQLCKTLAEEYNAKLQLSSAFGIIPGSRHSQTSIKQKATKVIIIIILIGVYCLANHKRAISRQPWKWRVIYSPWRVN